MKRTRQFVAVSLALALLAPSHPVWAAARSLSVPSVPLALSALPAAASLNAMRPATPALPTTPTVAALPNLQQLSGALSASKPGSQQSASALDRHFEAARPEQVSSDMTSVAGSLSQASSGLTPASIGAPARANIPPARAPRRPSGKANMTVIAIIGGIALVATIVIVVLLHNSSRQNELWKNSKSNQAIVMIEKARRDADAETLAKVATESRARQARMNERIADAKSRGENKVGDKKGDDLKTAEAYSAFDGLVGARAELNLNAVSSDPRQRLGGDRPETWQNRLSAEDARAKQTGREGSLALHLQTLKAELTREDQAEQRLEGDIKTFDAHVPGAFGGRLKDMSKRAAADLEEYKTAELAPEHRLQAQTEAVMRSRVTEALARTSTEYQSHQQRLERLSEAESPVKGALDLARRVDKDLADMAESKRMELLNLGLAAQNERVRVEDTDKQGRVIGHHYEDHSQNYKAMAATNAADAQASAASARAGVQALSIIMPQLRNDKTLHEEGLAFAIPNGSKTNIGNGGSSVFFDFFLPASWSFFNSVFSQDQASQARAGFGAVLGSLESVETELQGRRAAENDWINQQIDKEIARQIKEAR